MHQNKIEIYDISRQQLSKSISLPIDIALEMVYYNAHFYISGPDKIVKVDTNGQVIAQKELDSDLFAINKLFFDNETILITNLDRFKRSEIVLDLNLNEKQLSFDDSKDAALQYFTFINQEYWLCTSSGIYIYDKNGHLKNRLLPNINTSKVIIDRQKNYWISTIDNGIFIIPDVNLSHYPIASFEAEYFFKYHHEFYVLDKTGNIYQTDSNFHDFKKVYNDESNSQVYFYYIDTIGGKIFFTHTGKGSHSIDFPSFKNSTVYNFAIKDISNVDKKYTVLGANGFVGLTLSPNFIDKVSVWDTLYQPDKDNIYKLFEINPHVRNVSYNYRNMAVYVASNQGLIKSTPKGYEILKTQDRQDIFAKQLFEYEDSIYTLSNSGHFYKIEGDSNGISLQTPTSLNQIGNISRGKQMRDHLFLFTNNHIYIYNFSTRASQFLDINIIPAEVKDIIIDSLYNQILILQQDGIIKMPFNTPSTQQVIPKLYINKIIVDEQPYFKTLDIHLGHKANKVVIDYSIPEFAVTQKREIQYRMDEGEWNIINSKNNRLELLAFPEGVHTIEFMIDGLQSDAKIRIYKEKPFWKTWWFILLSIAGSISLFFYIYKRRERHLSTKINLLEEKVLLEQELGKSMVKSIKAQMNPHFFYNALNSIQGYIYLNDKKKAGSYLNKFSQLTRMILEMSEKDWISLEEELKALNLYLELEGMRFEDNFVSIINIDEEVEEDWVKIPSLLLQPYLENAIKHGLLHKKDGIKKLLLNINIVDEKLLIEIEDNGIGRKKSAELNRLKNRNHQSFATQANKKRIDLINKTLKEKIIVNIIDLKGKSQEPLGTKIEILIPLTQSIK